MIALALRIIKQVKGDKRSLIMLLFAPLLVLTLLNFMLGTSNYTPKIAVNNTEQSALILNEAVVTQLETSDATIIEVNNITDVEQFFIDNSDVDALLGADINGITIDVYDTTTKSAAAIKVVQTSLSELNPTMSITVTSVLGNEDASYFENSGYIFFGIFSFFLIFLVSGMSFVKERSNGTLERFLMSPISRISVVLGYTLGYGFYAVLQAILMVLFGVFVLGINNSGSLILSIVTMFLVAISAVSFGSLVSVFSTSELQVVQLMPILIIPQIFFSGIIPVDTIPYGLGNLGYITPIYYGCNALKLIMHEGLGISEVWPMLLGLVGFIFILSILNLLALKKYRTT